jgi:hypothetical protein
VTAPDPTEPQIVYPFSAPPQVVVEQAPARRTARLVLAGTAVVVVLAGVALAVVLLRPGGGQAGERGTAGAPATPSPSLSASPSPADSGSPSASPSPSPSRSASASPSPTDPNLLAGDEFAGPLDTTKWSVYTATNPNGSTWSPTMVQVAGGELRIAGVGRNPSGAGNTSGGLCWCGLGDRVYG